MTTQTKHTPGPWIICTDGEDSTAERIAQETKWGVVCQTSPRDCIDIIPCVINSQANARLIAAAPELFSELEKLAAWLERSDLPRNLRYAAEARAALAKARGEG